MSNVNVCMKIKNEGKLDSPLDLRMDRGLDAWCEIDGVGGYPPYGLRPGPGW